MRVFKRLFNNNFINNNFINSNYLKYFNYKFKNKPKKFTEIPYWEQYESRDFENKNNLKKYKLYNNNNESK